jgi:hypothetical protein
MRPASATSLLAFGGTLPLRGAADIPLPGTLERDALLALPPIDQRRILVAGDAGHRVSYGRVVGLANVAVVFSIQCTEMNATTCRKIART